MVLNFRLCLKNGNNSHLNKKAHMRNNAMEIRQDMKKIKLLITQKSNLRRLRLQRRKNLRVNQRTRNPKMAKILKKTPNRPVKIKKVLKVAKRMPQKKTAKKVLLKKVKRVLLKVKKVTKRKKQLQKVKREQLLVLLRKIKLLLKSKR